MTSYITDTSNFESPPLSSTEGYTVEMAQHSEPVHANEKMGRYRPRSRSEDSDETASTASESHDGSDCSLTPSSGLGSSDDGSECDDHVVVVNGRGEHTPSYGSPTRTEVDTKKRRRRRRPRKGRNATCSSEEEKNNRRLAQRLRQNGIAKMTEEECARFVALDCEMVGVGVGGYRSALARVCVVDWRGEVIFDTHVKVTEPVTDFRTFVSGVRPEDIDSDLAMDWEECRLCVLELLEGKILVGHGLRNDLRALNIFHPWQDTRDTAKYEPFMKCRFEDGILWPRKLKDLAKEKLGQEVQQYGREHDPAEDARTALELYKISRVKWEKVMAYKINRTREIEMQQEEEEEEEQQVLQDSAQ